MPGTDALCRWKITCSLGALLHHPLSLNSHFCLDVFGSRWIVLTSARGAGWEWNSVVVDLENPTAVGTVVDNSEFLPQLTRFSV